MTDQTQGAESAAVIDAPVPVTIGVSISNAYRTYILVVLSLVYVVNYLDRQIMGILSHQVKLEFHLTDFSVGILNGPAFAAVYAILGIPIAAFADRMNRRNVVAICIAIFSAATMCCGLARQFWQLGLARFGTGVGEAGTTPSINSMISDMYPPEKRASAISFYTAGLNIGLVVAFFGGGWVAQHYGWRDAFLISGISGVALVLLIVATLPEPKRGMIDNLADTAPAPGMWEVAKHLWSQRSFRWMSFGAGLSSFGGYAAVAFLASFFQISHHLTLVQASTILALFTGFAGAVGTYLAGFFADYFGKRDVKLNMMVPVVTALLAAPFAPLVYLPSNLTIVLVSLTVPALFGAAYVGPSYAMTQALVPLRMRARAIAIFLFILNAIGMCFGAPVVGEISDLLKPYLAADSLRWALLSTVITSLCGAYCYWRSTQTLKADIARVGG